MKKRKVPSAKAQEPKPRPSVQDDLRGIGVTGILGIGLVAGGLWNIPVLLKIPQTREDWMMLGLTLGLIFLGVLLLILPKPGSHDE